MAEEQEGGSIKGAIIGGVTLLITTITGVVATKFESIFGDKEEPKTEVVQPAAQPQQIVINNSQPQQASSGGTKTVIVKEKAAAEKPKPKTAKEEMEEAPKW
jgi:hypothetical protein